MKVAIITYSTYGHINIVAKAVQEGVQKSGAASQVDIFRVPETLSDDVLKLIHAPAKPDDIPVATVEVLEQYDAFLFGIPTRFGNLPSQFLSFFDQTGGLWAKGALYGKPIGAFVSTGSPQGGQETTIRSLLTFVSHHGLIFIPLGYASAFQHLTNLDEFHGGSPYGAGTYAGSDGSKLPTELELNVATIQGETFAKSAVRFVSTASSSTTEKTTTPDSAATTSTTKSSGVAQEKKPAAAAAASSSSKPAAKRAAQTAPAKKEKESTCSKCVIV